MTAIVIKNRLRRVRLGILAAGRIPTSQTPVLEHYGFGDVISRRATTLRIACTANAQQRGGSPPAEMVLRASTASSRVPTRTRSSPSCGAELASAQLSAGT